MFVNNRCQERINFLGSSVAEQKSQAGSLRIIDRKLRKTREKNICTDAYAHDAKRLEGGSRGYT